MNRQLTVQISDFEKQLPRLVIENQAELKAGMLAMTENYRGRIVTAGDIKSAKDDRAALNKIANAINSNRISAQKAWNKPMEAFKTACDELIKIAKEPAAAIDAQIKAFEEAEREEKREAIATFYAQNIKDLHDLLPLERIWDDKWLNKSVALNIATNELHTRIEAVRKEIATIQAMTIEHKDFLEAAYLRTLNIGAALDERRRYEDEQKALKRRKDEAEQRATAPPTTISVATPPTAVQFPPEVMAAPVPLPEELRDLGLRFYGTTKAFRQELKAVALKHGIRYEGGIINVAQ